MALPQVDQMARIGQGGAWYYTIRVCAPGGNYLDTWANFALDFGSALPALPSSPANVRGRIYVQGVRNDIVDGTLKQIDADTMPWDLGDQIIAAVPSMLTAQMARRFPPDGLLQKQAAKKNEICALAKHAIASNPASAADVQEKLLRCYQQIDAATDAKSVDAVVWPPKV
jgi:hypothetical protein